jgi:phage repressor protein C with HTH and peptisase S24 domain
LLLKERLKIVRKALKLTQVQLANVVGLTDTAIKQIEAGKTKTISYDYAKTWEKQFGISERWLRFEEGQMLYCEELSQLDALALDFELDEKLVTLPYFENIKASAGSGCINYECSNKYMKIPKTFIAGITNIKNLEIIKVSGDSMENTFFSEDLIIIDKDKTEPKNNKIFVILYESELFVKRVFTLPKSKILLNSDNTFYPSIEVKENEEFKIIGQVIFAINIKNLS